MNNLTNINIENINLDILNLDKNKNIINNRTVEEDTKISMMVTHVPFNGTIDMVKVLSLLPLRYIKNNSKSYRSKINLPDVEIPGEIIYTGYHDIKRGFIRSKKNNFENGISIDIAADKFVNLKVSNKTIQCAGAKKEKTCVDAINYLFNHIRYIQIILDRTKYNSDITNNTIEWLSRSTKGQEHYIISGTTIIVDTADIQKYQKEVYNYMQYNAQRSRIGRMLNFKIKEGIANICKILSKGTNNNILNEIYYKLNEGLVMIYNNITNEILIPIYVEENYRYPNQSIENMSNYCYYIYQVMEYYKLHIYKTDKRKKNYITYIYNNKMEVIYDDKYVDVLIKLHDLLEDYKGSPIYSDVELSTSTIFPDISILNNFDDDGYTTIKSDTFIKDDTSLNNNNSECKVDKYLADYLLKLLPDYTHHDLFDRQIRWFVTLDKLYEGDLYISKVKYSNLNFNYNLGDLIYLDDLKREFSNIDGFIVNRDKLSQKSVSIKLPFIIPDHLKDYIQKDQRSKKMEHTFTVYSKGSVTQSGPHYDMNIEAYHKFINAYEMIKNKVIKHQQE